MDLSLQIFLIVCPLVFLAGFVDSIAGGGGLISLPAYLIAGVPPHIALGTNKFSSCIGTFVSTIRYCKNKSVDWGIGIVSILLALIGSSVGASLALLVSESFIKKLLLFVLPVVAFFLLRNKNLNNDNINKPYSRKKTFLIACIASLIIACYDGFYGPGTGTFLILTYTGLAKMNVKIAAGNTKLVNLSSNIAALITFILNGKVMLLLGITAAFFSIAGHFLGSGLVLKNGSRIIKPFLIIVLALMFITILIDL